MKIYCDKCNYNDNIKKFLLSKNSIILKGTRYTKEKYKCPNCGNEEQTDWLVDN